MAVRFTFIRHGESVDNTRHIWAGWKDSPLTNHGMNQAKALGVAMADIRFTTIYSSTLQRALMTAQALLNAQKAPQPPLITSDGLREQHFGVAEGEAWMLRREPGLSFTDHLAKGIYPVPFDRTDTFPEGESSEDLARRAEKVVQELLLPHVRKAASDGTKGTHVAVVSHGLCIGEIITALVRMDTSEAIPTVELGGLRNTAWARVSVEAKLCEDPAASEQPLPLAVRVTDFNRHSHLDGVIRQRGGIGSAAYDPKQKDIKAYFGGGEQQE